MPKIKNILYATKADTVKGFLGPDFYISRSKYGRGLFAARDFEIGEIITSYDGDLIHDSDLGSRTRTHMLRVPGTDLIWDGYELTKRLVYDRTTQLFYPPSQDDDAGFGAVANSSSRGNAKIKWFYNDLKSRPSGYNPDAQTNLPGKDLKPKVPYLIASRPIDAGQEILWKYQVELDPDETEIDD